MNHTSLRWALLILISSVTMLYPAEPPHMHTRRSSPKLLPLPRGDDVFQFIIFGGRPGGLPEETKVLAQAVEDSNLPDLDLVMTAGDQHFGAFVPVAARAQFLAVIRRDIKLMRVDR